MPKKKRDDDKASFSSKARSWVLATGVPVAAIAIASLVSMRVPSSTPVEIMAEVNRVSLTAANSDNNPLLPHTAVCSLDLRGFQEVTIPLASIRVADPKVADFKTGNMPENGWRPWVATKALLLRPSEGSFPAKITLKTVTKCGLGLNIDGFHTGNQEVVLASPDKDYLSLDMRGEQHGSVEVPDEFEVDAEYCDDPNARFPLAGPEVRLRMHLAKGASNFLTFRASPSGLFAQLEFAPGKMQKTVISDFPVESLSFTNQGPLESPQSTLVGPGSISYYKKKINLAPGDSLIAERLKNFSVLELSSGKDEKSLSVHMKGSAGVLRSGRGTEVDDRRPTWFDAATGDPRGEAIVKVIKAIRDIFK